MIRQEIDRNEKKGAKSEIRVVESKITQKTLRRVQVAASCSELQLKTIKRKYTRKKGDKFDKKVKIECKGEINKS